MASAWIPWIEGLEEKPEVAGIAERTGLPRLHACGCLMRIWIWVLTRHVVYHDPADPLGRDWPALVPWPDHLKPDTHHTVYKSKRFIDSMVGIKGFAEAMIAVGWLRTERGVPGRYIFPKFGRHIGRD